MDKKRLEELKENCEFAIKHGHFMPEPDNVDLLALIDAALSHEATTDADVQAAINHYEYRVNKRQEDITFYRNSHNQELILAADTLERALVRDKIILAALQQYRPMPDCATAEWCGGKCCGYGKAENDDEPCDQCKACPKQAMYGVE